MIVASAFAEALRRLHERQGGDASAAPALQQAAVRLWEAVDDGHACVVLDDPATRRLLAASPAVGGPACAHRAPLVLDGEALYLQRLWQAEARLALRLVELDAPAPMADPVRVREVLEELAPAASVDPLQRAAIETALTRRLAIVTGGPGTGKTTTIARLLVAATRLAPTARIAIAAPTGKAAARLAQALAAQLARLAPGSAAVGLPTAGMTVHRLLGLQGEDSAQRADVPRHDLVIVDEASMLDLELARLLADSIPAGGRLVLAGDRDQLASVQAGAVFAEACASGLAGVARLERNYRQANAPALTALAGWLRDRCQAAAPSLPPFAPQAGLERLSASGTEPIAARALAEWEPALAAIHAGESAESVLAAFDRHRVLAALREGPLGTRALNEAIAARVRRRLGARPGAPWYPGRLVIVTRNRPELGLSNGDVGICLPAPGDSAALAIAFDAGAGKVRWLSVRQMPSHDDAFAITVHKSQGSEFDSVALVPGPAGHRLNTRELLYTGATRASARLAVWCEAATLEEGALRRTERHGRLADRIAALRAPEGAP